jgi:cell division protein FtsB
LVAEASAASTDALSASIKQMKSQLDEIGASAKSVNAQVESNREKIAGESDRLLSVSSAALEAAREATTNFVKQSESLFKASQDASKFAANIQKNATRQQREAFMGSAKFIVESLHSLSVDLTRMLDGEISEKTWKAFQKGDVGAFTRRLAEIEGKVPLEKARTKFTKDTEFRTYVQRFLRQFEEMYDQAVDNDHGGILTTSIGSSEVGKLYAFLCDVAGKKSIFEQRLLKVA